MKISLAAIAVLIIVVIIGCQPVPVKDNILFSFSAADSKTDLYSKEELGRQWNNPRWENGVSQGLASIVESGDPNRPKSLRVLYPRDGYSDSSIPAKTQWVVKLPEKYDELYFSYDIKFDKTFDFVKGGKLHGFAGGTHNSGGTKPSGTDGFTSRVVWLPEGRLGQYVYHPDQPDKYGQVFKYTINGEDFVVERDCWYKIVNRVVMNRPKEHDGIVQAWIDGNLVLDIRNLRFRDIDSLAIDSFYFTTFFGGADASFAPAKDEYIYFDNFIIAVKPLN